MMRGFQNGASLLAGLLRLFLLLLLAAGSTTMTVVTAATVTLPLRSASIREDGLGPRGTSKYQPNVPSVGEKKKTSAGVNVPVTDWFNRTDNQWYTTFSLGTPPQNFTALFDTGSPKFIIGGSNCTTCGTKTLFDPSLSSTYVDSPGTFVNYDFSTGADSIPLSAAEGATGYVVTDTLSWGNLTVKNQSFVLCDTMAEILNEMPIDGIMGMSIKGVSASSWYWELVEDGQLDSPYYSFYTPAGDLDGGEVTLGGVDATKYQGDIEWTKLATVATELFESYVVDQLAIYSDGVLLHNGTTTTTTDDEEDEVVAMPTGWAILDTGTAFMMTPDYQTAANVYAQISANITQIDAGGAWGAPCDELEAVAPELTFTLGNTARTAVNVTIPRASFNLGAYPGLDGICQALFNNPSDGIGSSWFFGSTAYWLVGSPLLKQYYTVWDGQDLKVGWAQIEGGPGF